VIWRAAQSAPCNALHFHIISTFFSQLSPPCHRPVTAHSETADVNRSLAGKMWKDTPKRTTFQQPFMAVKCSWKSQRISVTSDSPSQIVSRKLMAANVLHDAHQASADVFSVNHGESY